MPKDARKVIRSLEDKGFKRRHGGDVFFHLYVEGHKTPIFTKVSHGEKEIHDRLLGAMARQLRLTRRELDDLVECPMTHGDFVQLLKEASHIA
jgi:predicted RNA binding protein YcfA (HicA-like mRNA interferase family)